MKIQDSYQSGPCQVGNHRTSGSQGVDAANSSSQQRGGQATLDQIEVSAGARTVSRVLELDDAARAAGIDSLRQAYEKGALQVDSRALSHAMLADAVAAGRMESDLRS